MKLLVCGGRNYNKVSFVYRTLDILHAQRPVSLVITGGAKGADSIGHAWAHGLGLPYAIFFANWDYYKKGAGPVRNGWMLQFGLPDMVIAFPGGSGTADMVAKSIKAGLEVLEVNDG